MRYVRTRADRGDVDWIDGLGVGSLVTLKFNDKTFIMLLVSIDYVDFRFLVLHKNRLWWLNNEFVWAHVEH